MKSSIASIIRLIRVHQWVKNLFVFLPAFFAGKFFDRHLLFLSFVSFVLFSLSASCIYILNDWRDIEKDKLHPEKKDRPLASGAVSKKTAFLVGLVLFVLMCGLGWTFDKPKAMILLFGYILMNIGYSLGLKNIPIVDVMIIATGFFMRVLVGGYFTGIVISHWTIILTLTLALLMALGKRRGEFVSMEEKNTTRKSLEGYNLQFLDISIGMTSAVIVVSYLMFCMQAENLVKYGGYLHYSIAFVLLGVLRYLQQAIVFNKVESPTKMVYKDKFLILVLMGFCVYFFLLIYKFS